MEEGESVGTGVGVPEREALGVALKEASAELLLFALAEALSDAREEPEGGRVALVDAEGAPDGEG